ncbi:DUF7453 family protein [Verrucomicrobiota bacterium sgz303538]
MNFKPVIRLGLFAFALLCLRPAHAEQVVFSEIMYNPPAGKPEFIEIWNISRTPLDMGKWRFTDGITYEYPDFAATSPQAVFLKAGERILVSSATESATRAAYPTIPANVRIFGPFTGALANEGERVTLSDRNGVPICTVSYRDQSPWPKAADGAGHSLILRNENRMIDNFRVWSASFQTGGSPGLPDTGAPPSPPVRLSEVHFSANSAVEWIELQNTTGAAVDVASFFMASRADLSDKIPLSGLVPADGFASFDVNFGTAADGSITLYLLDSLNNVLGTAELQNIAGRPSMQAVYPIVPARIPSWQYLRLTPTWHAFPTDTRNALNSPAIDSGIVINEIMYDPPASHAGGEFIELYNKNAAPVDLTGWRIRGGVDFDFPAGTIINAGSYLVIARSREYMAQVYPGVSVLGEWSGTLKNDGDLIRVIDNFGNLADEVDFRPGGDWPLLAAGQGSSMELLNPAMDNSRASAWRDSDESQKAQWQTYTVTGTFQQLRADGVPTDYKELHLNLVGDSHVALRNIKLSQGAAGANILTNVGVQATNGSSATGWLMQGSHWASFIDTSGVLHLISDGRGDNRANRAEIDATGLTAGQSYTLQFEARWISGKSRLIAQTWDHSLGKAFLLPIPNNLGTPGAPNSVAAATPLPQVDSVLHSPAVPKTSDPVLVTARVTSQTPLAAIEVVHRADSVTNTNPWSVKPMVDDGTAGDAVANDGVYTAMLTEHQVNGRIVQFYVRATAASGGTSELPKNGATRPALWIVDSRTILTSSDLRKQRLIVPAQNRDALVTSSGESAKFGYDFPRLSNHYFNATFIHNEAEIYYNAELRKSGSPWTRTDDSVLDRGKWKLPGDRIFRNRDKFTFDNDATSAARHHNRLMRYWLYLLGHPVNENEFVTQMVNLDAPVTREDVEPVDGAMISRNFPDGNKGQLMRSDDEWWFQDNWGRSNRDADWSYKGTDEPIRYHTEWMLRSRENEYDYSSLTEFFRTVSNPGSSEELLNRVLDPNLTLMMAAVRGYAYDWDSLTLNRGKNGFMYRKPTDGRWMFLHWDSDLAFQDATNIVVGTRPGWSTYINKPWTRRIFNYYLTEMLTKLTRNSARVSSWFDAEEAASTAYTVDKNFYLTWFANRESRIVQEINTSVGGPGGSYTATFSVTSPAAGTTTTSATVNLTGVAPSRAFTVVVDGHPEATFRWINQTQWTISGLQLQSGANSLNVRMVDREGNTLGTITYAINRDGNAPPIVQFTSTPSSYNVKLGENFSIDASSSYDPDGGPLEFTWSTNPASGASIWHALPASTEAIFSQPGIYTLTAAATDTGGAKTEDGREVLVYHAQDFSAMNAERLEPHWTLQNVNERDNFANSAWYSTQDVSGTLLIQVLSDTAKPTNPTSPTHPLITRTLPATADFALQTDLYLAARQTGNFFTGLYVETVEDGTTVRYLYGLENGTLLTVKRSTGGGYTNTASQSSTGGSAVIRVRRVGNELRFQRRTGDVWATTSSVQTLPQGATAVRGGIFVATAIAQEVRVGFDYIALADTSRSSSKVRDSLRITEIMYNPKAPDTAEFIELQNTGAEQINLQGVRFDDGAPVDGMIFGNETLAPGEYITVTNSVAAFRARYGETPRLAGQWVSGSLSNSGERIVLRDVDGTIIQDFTYSDTEPWPVAADGGGRSLEIKDTTANYNDPASWTASVRLAGSPGRIGTNAAPVATNDVLHPVLDSLPLLLNVLANDSDPDGDVTTIVDLGTPEHGSVTTDGNIIRYQPGLNFTGNDTFSYTISDGVNGVATAVVTLQNAQPTALADTLHVPWTAGPLVLNVRENDADPDGDEHVIIAVSNGSLGSASTDGNTLTYSPGEGFTGSDSFTYTISDRHGGLATGTVTLVNSAPIAGNDTAATDGTAITISVLTNDTDPDGDLLTVVDAKAGSHGATVIEGSEIVYTPGVSYQGDDSFSYTISDGHGGQVTAQVTIRNGGVMTRTAAETGAQVPGAPPGTTYLSLQVPAVGDDGSLAWLARVRTPGSKQAKAMLIGGNPARALLTEGDPVPGLPAGIAFAKLYTPVCDDTGSVIFVADLKGGGITKKDRTGIFVTQPDGSTAAIARLGAPAVGLSGSVLSKFLAVDANDGEILYVAKTTGGGRTGIWAWDGATTRLVSATGTQVTSDLGAKTITAVDLLKAVAGSPGHNRSHRAGLVTLKLTFSDKTQAIGHATLEAGEWKTKVHTQSGQSTGFGGTWKSFGTATLGASGSTASIGVVNTGGKATQPVLAVFDENGPSEIIRAGDQAPSNTTLLSFSDPVTNTEGAIAFTARVRGVGIKKATATRLFLVPPGGELALVAAPGQPAGAGTGLLWSKIMSYALPPSANSAPLFLATVTGSGVTKKNNLGLWTQNSDGTPLLLARTGQPAPGVSPSKIISKLTLLNAIPPVHGSARSFNASRTIAYLVTFTDGTQAIQVQRLP